MKTEKDDVTKWETVASYNAEGDGLGPYPVQVEIGKANGAWFGRTIDDAGGDDDAPDEPIGSSETEAWDWGKDFANEMDESPDEDELAEEIAAHGFWKADMTPADILAIANAATDRQSGSRLWVSDHGEMHWDTGNTIRVEGWDDCVVIGASHTTRAAALNALLGALRGDDE